MKKEIKKIIKFKKESLECLSKNLGEDHPETIYTEYALGQLYMDIEDYQSAYTSFKNVKNIIKNDKNKTYSEILELIDYSFICACYFSKKYLEVVDNAPAFIFKVKKDKIFDEESLITINNIADAYYRCNNINKALELCKFTYKHALEDFNAFPVPKYLSLSIVNYVGLLNSQNKVKKARDILLDWELNLEESLAEEFGEDIDNFASINILGGMNLVTNRIICDYLMELLDGNSYFTFADVLGDSEFHNFLHDIMSDLEELGEDNLSIEDKHLSFPFK